MNRHFFKKNIALVLIWALVFATQCIRLSYFDNTTYKNLTDTKPQVELLFESFKSTKVDTLKVNEIKLKIYQIYEYEKGKGDDNTLTANQLETIKSLFNRSVKDRFENGKWSETYANDKIENISKAFNLLIQTENLKNKKK